MCDTTDDNKSLMQQRENVVVLLSKAYKYQLLWNVHLQLPLPAALSTVPSTTSVSSLMRGNVAYFHYNCDGDNDIGWGCAYRTLQSLCSWILTQRLAATSTSTAEHQVVPSIREIQETLVRIGDKRRAFVGSREWIGALEVCYVLDTLYDVPSKILHVTRRDELRSHVHALKAYFEEVGGLVMMGGDVDAASKGIAGVHIVGGSDVDGGNDAYLLVVDPHYVGTPATVPELIKHGFVRWQHVKDFVDSSFYNLCLPQLKL